MTKLEAPAEKLSAIGDDGPIIRSVKIITPSIQGETAVLYEAPGWGTGTRAQADEVCRRYNAFPELLKAAQEILKWRRTGESLTPALDALAAAVEAAKAATP